LHHKSCNPKYSRAIIDKKLNPDETHAPIAVGAATPEFSALLYELLLEA
jgi:hypothetical protein